MRRSGFCVTKSNARILHLMMMMMMVIMMEEKNDHFAMSHLADELSALFLCRVFATLDKATFQVNN